jgi:hypothetical protein
MGDPATTAQRITNFAELAEACERAAATAEALRQAAGDFLSLVSYDSTADLFTFADMTYALRNAGKAAKQLAEKYGPKQPAVNAAAGQALLGE